MPNIPGEPLEICRNKVFDFVNVGFCTIGNWDNLLSWLISSGMGDQSIDQGANCGHFGANDVELLEGPSLFLHHSCGAVYRAP